VIFVAESRIPSVLTVKPSTALRTDYKRFSELCHATDDPILVTNNGENDLVVMSHEAFCRREAWYRLQMKLASADRQIAEGNLTDHTDVMARLKGRIRNG
jgi:PHD/YefM family antitoxin component YafN of YafNO toxin-antitoxin module